MNRLRKLKCWWFGHRPKWTATVVPCERCGVADIPYYELVEIPRSTRTQRAFTYWAFRRWFPKKCRECGKRYGDHDSCLPF